MHKNSWTKYSRFPSPLRNGYLNAPFGPGLYELKNKRLKKLVYVGEGIHVSYRMSSLLPKPYGTGTRNNLELRGYIFENFKDIYYRTLACASKTAAKQIQDEMITQNTYIFN